MRRLFLTALLLVLLTGCTASAEQELVVEGPEEFRTTVQNALALIEEKSPAQYRDVERLVKRVVLEDTAPVEGCIAWGDTAFTVHILNKAGGTYGNPFEKTSVAASIVHEMQHFIQLAEKRPYRTLEGEREALQAERVFLTTLGFTTEVLDLMRGEDALNSRAWEALPQ